MLILIAIVGVCWFAYRLGTDQKTSAVVSVADPALPEAVPAIPAYPSVSRPKRR
jgi:hypothetical protein